MPSTLNNKSKHRDLIAIATNVGEGQFRGSGYVRKIEVYGLVNPFYNGEPFILLDADEGIKFNVSANIAFREAVVSNKPFVETLYEFASMAKAIINAFG